MEKITYTITDKNGIHARPAGLIVECAKSSDSSLRLICGEKSADCRKLFQLMQLGVRGGDTVTIEASGGDESAAVRAMDTVMRSAGL